MSSILDCPLQSGAVFFLAKQSLQMCHWHCWRDGHHAEAPPPPPPPYACLVLKSDKKSLGTLMMGWSEPTSGCMLIYASRLPRGHFSTWIYFFSCHITSPTLMRNGFNWMGWLRVAIWHKYECPSPDTEQHQTTPEWGEKMFYLRPKMAGAKVAILYFLVLFWGAESQPCIRSEAAGDSHVFDPRQLATAMFASVLVCVCVYICVRSSTGIARWNEHRFWKNGNELLA